MDPHERTPLKPILPSSIICKDPTSSTRTSTCWSQTCTWNWIPNPCKAHSFLIKDPPLGAIYLYPNAVTATWLAVIFIFIMAGLSMKSNEFAKAATRLRFNLFVLGFNFFVVSSLVFGMTKAIRHFNLVNKGLTDGMVACSCLPITVSIVIVLTKSAKGYEASAVLLAAVGSLVGIFLSPNLILGYIGFHPTITESPLSLGRLYRHAPPQWCISLKRIKDTSRADKKGP
jgi:hypothetical protein